MDANSLLRKWQAKKSPDDRTVIKAPPGESVPLTLPQERLWLLQFLNPHSPFYNYCELLSFSDKLRSDDLVKALSFVVDRNKVFFHQFTQEGGVLLQKADETIEFRPRRQEEKLFRDDVEAWAKGRGRVPFDLSSGPLIRADLAEYEDGGFALVLSFHHIVIDAWSVGLFRQQLAEAYVAIAEGGQPNLPSPDLEFADYAFAERSRTISTEKREGLKYERKLLPTLPYDHIRPPRITYEGEHLPTTLPQEVSSRLKHLVQVEQVTEFTFFLAVFQLLLSKYGNEQISIGLPATRRNQSGVGNLIGFFTETAVMLSDLTAIDTFSELLKTTDQYVNSLRSGQITSFDEVVSELGMGRSLAENPIFQIMFVYHQAAPSPFRDTGLHQGTKVIPLGVSKFDLTLHVFSDGNDSVVAFEYSTDLFARETVEGLLSHYTELLKEVSADHQAPLTNYGVHTPQQSQFLKKVQNVELHTANQYETVLDWIDNHFLCSPEKPAVSFGDETLTYGDLDAQSRRIATALLVDKYEGQSFIGILMPRSLGYVSAILGVFRAGKAYVPLDPEIGQSRLREMIEDSGIKTVIVLQSEDTHGLNSLSFTEMVSGHQPTQMEFPHPDSEAIAYTIYTSGSTGRPKGVAITHGNLVSSTEARIDYYKEAPERFLHVSPFFFDSSVAGLFWVLCEGGHLVVSEPRWEQDLSRAARFLQEKNVTHSLMLPSLYEVLIQSIPDSLSALRVLIVAGEACPPQLVASHFQRSTAELYNEYGPTEGTVWCLAHHVTQADARRERIPIGRPVRNTMAIVTDEQGQQMPMGIAGRLHIAGPSVIERYFSDVKDNEEKFRTISGFGNLAFYDTGDLVRINSKGLFEFLGRADTQVKVRGYRIELADITAAVESHDDVQTATVVLRSSAPTSASAMGVDQIVCFYVGDEGLTTQQFRSFLANRLPSYMVPDDFVSLKEMPRLPNGKIDNSQLRYEKKRDAQLEDRSKVGTEVEEKIREVWKRVLGLEYIGLQENFFEIGGTSLLSIRIIQQCRELEIYFTPGQFFKYQTIEQLAEGLDKAKYKSPANNRQIQLIKIWEKTLGTELIGVQDDFYVLGGDDNQSAGMLKEVARQTGITVFPGQLPSLTVEELDHKLTPVTEDQRLHRTIPVRSSGRAVPLFCIQSEFYFETVYQELARHLNPDIPVFGVLSVSPTLVKEHTPQSIEEIADLCVQEIKTVRPSGPYHVAGFSIANAISFEVVRRLEREGHEATLFMIGPPMILSKDHSLAPSRGNRVRYFLSLLLRPAVLWQKLLGKVDARNLGENNRRYIEGVFQQTGLLVKLINSYRFSPIKSKTLFIDSDQDPVGYKVYSWDKLLTGVVRKFKISGEHNLMIRRPMVEQVAKIIDEVYAAESQDI